MHPKEPVGNIGSGSDASASEQEMEQSNKKVVLAPPPGIATQSIASEKALQSAPPRTALPSLLVQSSFRHTTKQQEKRSGVEAPVEPPPGLAPPAGLIETCSVSQGFKFFETTVREDQKPCEAIELPPDFKAPPGLEHMVDLSCYNVLNTPTHSRCSRAPSEDDLTTIAGSEGESSSEDEPSPIHRRHARPAAESFASVELHLNELVGADEASHNEARKRLVTHMPMIPFVPAAAVQMAWQQWYGWGAIRANCNRIQAKA